jgi:hypothetical protein
MIESHLEEYEALLLRPERWQQMTPEERTSQATWFLFYTRVGYKRLQQFLIDPNLPAKQQEKYKRGIERLLRREEKILALGYTDEATYASIAKYEEAELKSGPRASRVL